MSDFTIEQLAIPETLDAPDSADFVASVDARNAAEVAAYGTAEVAYPPEELLPYWHDPHEPKVLWGARVDGRIMARATHEWQLDDESVGWVHLHVHPDVEHGGIGRALADTVEQHARSLGRSRLITYAVSVDAPGERLVPPTGAGSVPLAGREVRFLLARGWRLEQIARASRFAPRSMPRMSRPGERMPRAKRVPATASICGEGRRPIAGSKIRRSCSPG